MALSVQSVGGCQCSKGLRWESCNWPKFLSCWLILEVNCGAEDEKHLGKGTFLIWLDFLNFTDELSKFSG